MSRASATSLLHLFLRREAVSVVINLLCVVAPQRAAARACMYVCRLAINGRILTFISGGKHFKQNEQSLLNPFIPAAVWIVAKIVPSCNNLLRC
jgi:hypothetical protein